MAAQAYLHGMDGLDLVTAPMSESIFLLAVLHKASELRVQELEGLAAEIRHQIVEAWNKGQKGK